MKIRIAKFAVGEMIRLSLLWIALGVLSILTLPWAVAIPILGFLFSLYFFRDPFREIPQGENLVLSPADGRVTEISKVEQVRYLGEPALKIGIFLSIFDAHINRAPTAGKVRLTSYQPGKFYCALRREASASNESNVILIEHKGGDFVYQVKQIAGAIARRILCTCRPGHWLEPGQKIGMIKFGSRTELYIPAHVRFKLLVQVNDKVKAGQTILGLIES
jgi:phosphatidylserine decarboxylase